jgi:hypothetical protein
MRVPAMNLDRREIVPFSDFGTAGPHHRIRVRQQPLDEFGVGVGVRDHALLRAGQETEQRSTRFGVDRCS